MIPLTLSHILQKSTHPPHPSCTHGHGRLGLRAKCRSPVNYSYTFSAFKTQVLDYRLPAIALPRKDIFVPYDLSKACSEAVSVGEFSALPLCGRRRVCNAFKSGIDLIVCFTGLGKSLPSPQIPSQGFVRWDLWDMGPPDLRDFPL